MREIREKLNKMQVWEGPTDIFGYGVYRAITNKRISDPKYDEFINKLENLNIRVNLDYYPIMMKFDNGNFEVTRDVSDKPSVIIKIKTQDFMDIVDGKSSIIKSFLTFKMKMPKGITKMLKIYKIFSKMMN